MPLVSSASISQVASGILITIIALDKFCTKEKLHKEGNTIPAFRELVIHSCE